MYTGLMQGAGAAEKIFEYLDREPKHPADGTEAPEACTGLVEFKDVTFAYPTRPKDDVLKVCSRDLALTTCRQNQSQTRTVLVCSRDRLASFSGSVIHSAAR